MLINTEQDLYAACDQYQGKTITLTKPGHTAWSHLTLQSVGSRTQLNSHIPIIMQIRTDRGTYELTPPFEITEEVQLELDKQQERWLTDDQVGYLKERTRRTACDDDYCDLVTLALEELQVRRYNETVR